MNRWKKFGAASVKWLLLVLSVAVVAVALVAGYRYSFKDDRAPLQAARQLTATVARGNITVTISGTGSIKPVRTKSVNAGASGTIDKVLVEAGDTVAEGDVLAVFESPDNTTQIRLKELELERSKLELEQLQKQYITADDESRKTIGINIEKQKLSILSVEEELADLKNEEQAGQIVAPIGGKITALNVNEGDSVTPNTVVAELADYSQLQITVPIDELDITKVENGQTATIHVEAFPDETFTGKVTEIADQGNYNNGVATFDVTVQVDDPGNIKAGMSAEVGIQVASRDNVLLLPVDAVQSAGGRYFVITPASVAASASPSGSGQQGRRPTNLRQEGAESADAPDSPTNSGVSDNRRVFIETGISNEDYIEIVSGLNEGDIVILPTAASSSSNENTGFPGGGFLGREFPGGGGLGSGLPGGGFPGGGASGGGFRGGSGISGGFGGGR